MTDEVTPEGLYNHNVCIMMWHYTASWNIASDGGQDPSHGKGQAGGGLDFPL